MVGSDPKLRVALSDIVQRILVSGFYFSLDIETAKLHDIKQLDRSLQPLSNLTPAIRFTLATARLLPIRSPSSRTACECRGLPANSLIRPNPRQSLIRFWAVDGQTGSYAQDGLSTMLAGSRLRGSEKPVYFLSARAPISRAKLRLMIGAAINARWCSLFWRSGFTYVPLPAWLSSGRSASCCAMALHSSLAPGCPSQGITCASRKCARAGPR